jgi:hypothetical protein
MDHQGSEESDPLNFSIDRNLCFSEIQKMAGWIEELERSLAGLE